MLELKQSKPSKSNLNKLKSELIKLKQEHGNIIKLVNIAKPASLPPLVAEYATTSSSTTISSEKKSLPIFGKRKKVKVQLPMKPANLQSIANDDVDDDDEEMEDDERTTNVKKVKPDEEIVTKEEITLDQFEVFVKEKIDEHPELERILHNMKILTSDAKTDHDEMIFIQTKQKEVKRFFEEKHSNREEISKQLGERLSELLALVEEKAKLSDAPTETSKKCNIKENKSTKKDFPKSRCEEKRKKQKRMELEEMEKKKGYTGYENSEDYSMWVPPSGQTGDGRTSLNDKYGY